MLRFYGLDLQRDLGTDRLSWRRLGVLLEHLPPTSSTVRAVGGERTEWGYTEHLLATVVDLLAQANYLFVAANSKTKPTPPEPLKRPGERKKKTRSRAEIDRLLAKGREVAARGLS